MGTEYSPQDLQRAMEEIDSDKDDFINIEEFAQLCRSSSSSGDVEELREAFDMYDENKDGLITEAELHQMIEAVDSDGDKRVNYQEFQKMMAASNGVAAAPAKN
ncbi:Probable calcium-binding protein CML26 [Linum perenne]